MITGPVAVASSHFHGTGRRRGAMTLPQARVTVLPGAIRTVNPLGVAGPAQMDITTLAVPVPADCDRHAVRAGID